MKHLYMAAAALFLVSQPPLSARADSDHKWDPQKMEEKKTEHQKKKLEKMTKELSLSDDQKSAIKKIMEERSEKMMALHQEIKEKNKALTEESETQIKALLNDEQKAKYDKLKSEMRDERNTLGKGKKR